MSSANSFSGEFLDTKIEKSLFFHSFCVAYSNIIYKKYCMHNKFEDVSLRIHYSLLLMICSLKKLYVGPNSYLR